jgi:hypothetical protein
LRFAGPIVLENGVKLTTLRDAIAHLGKAIPESDHDMPAVLTAAEMLTNAAENVGPVGVRAHRHSIGVESSRRPRLQF